MNRISTYLFIEVPFYITIIQKVDLFITKRFHKAFIILNFHRTRKLLYYIFLSSSLFSTITNIQCLI